MRQSIRYTYSMVRSYLQAFLTLLFAYATILKLKKGLQADLNFVLSALLDEVVDGCYSQGLTALKQPSAVCQ